MYWLSTLSAMGHAGSSKAWGGRFDPHLSNSFWGSYWGKNFAIITLILFKGTISDHPETNFSNLLKLAKLSIFLSAGSQFLRYLGLFFANITVFVVEKDSMIKNEGHRKSGWPFLGRTFLWLEKFGFLPQKFQKLLVHFLVNI